MGKSDPIDKMTQMTPNTPEAPVHDALALDTGNYEVLCSSQCDYTIHTHQQKATCKLTLQLVPKSKKFSVLKAKHDIASTLATPNPIGLANIAAFSVLKDQVRITKSQYTRASPTILRHIHGYVLPMRKDGGSGISMFGEVATSELNIEWKHVDWKVITANGNCSDLTKVT